MYTIPVMEGGTNMLEDKVRDVFSDMVVLKNPERTEFFSNLSLPSYMRDWLVMKFSDDDGIIDYDSVLRYIRQYIPSREDFEQFKFEMVNGETVRFLARIRVNVDIKTGKTLFELPDFGGSRSGASGEVANDVVSRWKETLLKESENWGIVELIWGKDYSSRQGKGVIKLIEYSPFCPYTVDLASCIGATPEEIIFTSGGTESDNWAIKGSALLNANKHATITSAFEHHAVLHPCQALERSGYPVAYMWPSREGYITAEILKEYITGQTHLTSVMFANNEIGTVQPIKELCAVLFNFA